MKQITALKLTGAVTFVAALTVGCASSGYARYDDTPEYRSDVGLSASAPADADLSVSTRADADLDSDLSARTDIDVSPDANVGVSARSDTGYDYDVVAVDDTTEGEARSTVSALSFNPDTRATWVTKFPFDRQIRVIETYTFAPPDPKLDMAVDAPRFSASMPPGSVYVEAAGGAGEVRTGRVIQHSPNPVR
jgi:hypothetical protein